MAELTVDLLLEDKGFQRRLKQAVSDANKSGKKIGDGITGPISTGMASIGKIASGFAVGSLLLQIPNQISRAFSASIDAAKKQEDAINQLNSALKRTGDFSKSTSEDLQSFASALQRQSIIGDEVIIQQIAYAKSLGLSNEQSKEFVQAALNASAALGKDFGGTLQQLLKTLSGLQGEIGESVGAIRNLTAEQLKAGEAAKVFNRQFAGAAKSQLDTYSGSVAGLGNAFGDFTESLGQYVTQSKDVNSATKSLTDFFADLALKIKPNKSIADSIQIVQNEIRVLQESIAQARASLARGGLIDRVALRRNISDSSAEIDVLLMKIEELKKQDTNQTAGAFGPFQEAIKATKELTVKQVEEIKNSIKTMGLTQIEQIRLVEQEQIAALEKARAYNDDRILTEQEYQDRLLEIKRVAAEQERAILNQRKTEYDSFVADINAFAVSVATSLYSGFAEAASSAFASFGRALVSGENALEAFGKAFLASIGQTAIQLGTMFILKGIAYSFDPLLGGPAVGGPLIAAGAGLATFGGVLTAVGGASGGSPAAGGGTGFAPNEFQPSQDLRSDLVTDERLEPETRVQLNIQGDVLDSTESGIRIAKILQDAIDTQNIRVIGGLA